MERPHKRQKKSRRQDEGETSEVSREVHRTLFTDSALGIKDTLSYPIAMLHEQISNVPANLQDKISPSIITSTIQSLQSLRFADPNLPNEYNFSHASTLLNLETGNGLTIRRKDHQRTALQEISLASGNFVVDESISRKVQLFLNPEDSRDCNIIFYPKSKLATGEKVDATSKKSGSFKFVDFCIMFNTKNSTWERKAVVSSKIKTPQQLEKTTIENSHQEGITKTKNLHNELIRDHGAENVKQIPGSGFFIVPLKPYDLMDILLGNLGEEKQTALGSDHKNIMCQLLNQVEGMHRKEEVGLDIKAENIFVQEVDRKFTVQAFDFAVQEANKQYRPSIAPNAPITPFISAMMSQLNPENKQAEHMLNTVKYANKQNFIPIEYIEALKDISFDYYTIYNLIKENYTISAEALKFHDVWALVIISLLINPHDRDMALMAAKMIHTLSHEIDKAKTYLERERERGINKEDVYKIIIHIGKEMNKNFSTLQIAKTLGFVQNTPSQQSSTTKLKTKISPSKPIASSSIAKGKTLSSSNSNKRAASSLSTKTNSNNTRNGSHKGP